MLKSIISIVGITLIIASCSSAYKKHQTEGPIAFQTVLSGQYSKADTAALYLIDNDNQWRKIWDMAMGKQDPLPKAPTVDFEHNMVLAVFRGQKNAAGYRNEITNITQKGEKLMVVVKNHHSTQGMVLPVVTSPFHMVTIPKGKYKLEVRYEQVNE